MSKKRKITEPVETEVKPDEVTSYREFFHDSLAKGLVKSWQEREIHAFFRDIGLTDKEPTDTYKIALSKF